jgi:hypothetical protein
MKFELVESFRGAPGYELWENPRRSAKTLGRETITIAGLGAAGAAALPDADIFVAGSAICFEKGSQHCAANFTAIRTAAARKKRAHAA